MVIIWQRLTIVWITGNIKVLYVGLLLSEVKTRSISILTYICSRYIFQGETTVPVVFFRPGWKCKGNFMLKSSNSAFEELPPNLELEVINLQCNDILKGNYQGTTVIEFYKWLLNDEYSQLKSYAYGLIAIYGSIYMWKDIFKIEIYKISF